MDELHEAFDKLFTETDHLDRILGDGVEPETLLLLLSVAKNVRRHSTLVVRLLAAERDNQLQPEEAQANEQQRS